MKFKVFSSLIAASTILCSVLPANADPYMNVLSSRENNFRCSDIVKADDLSSQGSFAQNNSGSSSYSSAYSSQYNHSNSRNSKLGGGFNGWGANFSNGYSSSRKSANSRQNSSDSSFNRDFQGAFQQNHIIHSAKGKNCDAADVAEGRIQEALVNASVNSKLIESKERVRTREIESNAQTNLFNTLMQGW